MQALAWSEKATAVLRQPVSGAHEERLQALLLDGTRLRLRLPLLSRLEQRLRSWQWHQEARAALLGMESASAGMCMSFPAMSFTRGIRKLKWAPSLVLAWVTPTRAALLSMELASACTPMSFPAMSFTRGLGKLKWARCLLLSCDSWILPAYKAAL